MAALKIFIVLVCVNLGIFVAGMTNNLGVVTPYINIEGVPDSNGSFRNLTTLEWNTTDDVSDPFGNTTGSASAGINPEVSNTLFLTPNWFSTLRKSFTQPWQILEDLGFDPLISLVIGGTITVMLVLTFIGLIWGRMSF